MKILYILFFSTFLYASNNIFLLPKQYDEGLHYLLKQLKHATSNVMIMTPELNHYKIKTTIVNLLKKGLPITFITASRHHMGVELVQYKHFELHTFDKLYDASLTFSLIVIDNTFTCKLSTSMDEKQMKHDLSLLECGTTATNEAKALFNEVMPYTEPYLKEQF